MINDEDLNPNNLVNIVKSLLSSEKGTFGEKKTLGFVKAFLRNVETVEAYALQEEDTWEAKDYSLNTVNVSYVMVRGKTLISLEYHYIPGNILVSKSLATSFPYIGHRCFIILNTGRGQTSKIDLNSRNLQIPTDKLPLLLNDPKLSSLAKAKLQGLL